MSLAVGRVAEGTAVNADGPTDAVLLADLRTGSAAAFEALFQRHYAHVYGVVHRLAPDEADDLAQEVFLRLYRRPPGRREANLPAWLHRVALNLGYNALRSSERRARGVEALRADDEADWLAARSVRGPEVSAERRQEQEAVRAALRRLGKRQTALLVLRHMGLSYREVAGVLGVAPGSVGTLLARAEKAFVRAYARVGSGGGQGG